MNCLHPCKSSVPGTFFSRFFLVQGASREESPCPLSASVITEQRGPFLRMLAFCKQQCQLLCQGCPQMQVTVLPLSPRPARGSPLQVLQRAPLRESSSIAEPSSVGSASEPGANRQALTWHVASLTAPLSCQARGVSRWKGLSDNRERNWGDSDGAWLSSVRGEAVLRLRSVLKARASQPPALLLL